MARVPVQKQTTGTHSVLSELELFTAPASFPSNGNETQSLLTHSVQVCWVLSCVLGKQIPTYRMLTVFNTLKVKYSKKTTSAGYVGNCSPNDMV